MSNITPEIRARFAKFFREYESTTAYSLFSAWTEATASLTKEEAFEFFQTEFARLSAAKQTFNTLDQPKPSLPTISSLALEAKPLPKPTWIVEHVIPTAGLVAISGKPGSYKSFWALWLALRISEGLTVFEAQDEPFFCEQKTAKCPVLFIEEENTEILVRDRMLGLKTPRSQNLHFRIDQGFKLGEEKWLKAMEEDIHRLGVKLVIMDPFSSVMGLMDENNNAEVAQKMDVIRKTFLEKGVTVVFLHHPSKGDDSGKNLRGAGDILGKCDVHLHLEKDEIDKKLVTVSYEKMRLVSDDQVQNFKMRLSGDTFFGDGEFRHVGAAKPKYEEERDELGKKIIAAMSPGVPSQKSHVAEAIGSGLNDKRFKAAWAQLEAEGKLKTSFEKKNGHPLFLRPLT